METQILNIKPAFILPAVEITEEEYYDNKEEGEEEEEQEEEEEEEEGSWSNVFRGDGGRGQGGVYKRKGARAGGEGEFNW